MKAVLVVGALLLVCCRESQGYYGMDLAQKTTGSVWPKPQQQSFSFNYLELQSTTFQILPTGNTCELLDLAISRYLGIIFNSTRSSSAPRRFPPRWRRSKEFRGSLNVLEVLLISECETSPHLGMDEQYELKIDTADLPMKAQLSSVTIWGALRGLETFSQLIHKDEFGALVVNSTLILDYPRFSHRGILLDTSRHYLSKKKILDNLDAMAYNKMNVFHWHIVDDTSFPYQSTILPNLSDKGAYNPITHIYTQQDILEIIEYARVRGIRVMPEFDTPGHVESWGKGYPQILTQCYLNGTQTPNGVGPINPTLNSSYTFMETLFSEIAATFPEEYIHLGGDEVQFDCWQTNPDITAFMTQMGFGNDYTKLEGYYIAKLLNIVEALPGSKSYIVWQEVVDNNVAVNANTVVEVWMGGWEREMAEVTNKGLKTLLASCWYLDHVNGNSDWRSFYTCEPLAFNGTDQQKLLVMGGEACLWAELVDGNNVISRLWPRGSAPAERLWSDASVNDVDEASARLEEHRCRMISRGIGAEPQSGPGFCDDDYLV